MTCFQNPDSSNKITNDVDVQDCVQSLDKYGDLAASEALTRALVAERTNQRDVALFWIKVYEGVVSKEAQLTI